MGNILAVSVLLTPGAQEAIKNATGVEDEDHPFSSIESLGGNLMEAMIGDNVTIWFEITEDGMFGFLPHER